MPVAPLRTRDASPRAHDAARVRPPLWHGTAFLIEALVLVAFLMAALAVVLSLFASARAEEARAARLSEAVTLAQNAAEAFAATDEPVSRVCREAGAQTGDLYVVAVDVAAEERATGTLYTATISVTTADTSEESDTGAAGAGDAKGAAGATNAESAAGGEALYTLDTARYVAASASREEAA